MELVSTADQQTGQSADLSAPPTSFNIMDRHGHKLFAIIEQGSSAPGCKTATDLEANFETICLKEGEEVEEDAEFDEILHRKRVNTEDWREDSGGKYLEAPDYQAKGKRVSPVWSEDDFPLGLRLAPIGQDRDEEEQGGVEEEEEEVSKEELEERVRQMEGEQEELTGSLQALTSHYARLQLRLQQVMAAPAEKREELLVDLQKFAFMGIPNIRHNGQEEGVQAKAVEEQRRLEAQTITSLRGKLEELESYAYQAGEAAPPSSLLIKRQKMIIDQLKEKLNLEVSDIASLSEEELRKEVDSKLSQIVNPLKMKSQLVGQLQTQITDLEMFIQFLQEESCPVVEDPVCGCDTHDMQAMRTEAEGGRRRSSVKQGDERRRRIQEHEQNINILKRTLSVLQSASVVASLGCGSQKFRSNAVKSSKGAHYGDLRAKLEVAVEHLLDVACTTQSATREDILPAQRNDDIPTDSEFLIRSPEVTVVVRKELAVAIRDLIHHGLGQRSSRVGRLPFVGCMSGRPSAPTGILHAWDVVTRFYELKGGAEFNSAPARRLSRSFGLDLAPTTSNNKQVLLQTIGQILGSHSTFRRSPDQHFKAFISAGLNKRKLVPWLRLILRNQTILETMYETWSYAVTTGFDDAFRALERLSLYVFDLPVNLAVKQFQELEDAF